MASFFWLNVANPHWRGTDFAKSNALISVLLSKT